MPSSPTFSMISKKIDTSKNNKSVVLAEVQTRHVSNDSECFLRKLFEERISG